MTLTSVSGFQVGHAQVPGGGSGCTVVVGSFRGVVEVRGMATGTRELNLLSFCHLAPCIDGVVFTGGSAFGLAAADGVVDWLSERGRGFDTGAVKVPLVPGAVIFDLEPGVARPGPEEGFGAADVASAEPVEEGRVGAGTGATVGKAAGPGCASPGGIGSASSSWKDGRIGVLAVVNALGDVIGGDGSILAGARGADGSFLGSDALVGVNGDGKPPFPGTNTTLVAVGTDLPLGKPDLARLARMACTAFPRAISPVHTPFDGDLVFTLSSDPNVQKMDPGEILSMGILARDLTEEAIRRAVTVAARSVDPEAGKRSGGPVGGS